MYFDNAGSLIVAWTDIADLFSSSRSPFLFSLFFSSFYVTPQHKLIVIKISKALIYSYIFRESFLMMMKYEEALSSTGGVTTKSDHQSASSIKVILRNGISS